MKSLRCVFGAFVALLLGAAGSQAFPIDNVATLVGDVPNVAAASACFASALLAVARIGREQR